MHAYRKQPKIYVVAAIAAIALTLGSAGCKSAAPAAPAIDDATLSSTLQSRIANDGALSKEAIQTSVQNGVATLNGNVSSEAARSLAASDAAQIAGIRTVVNNLSVQQPVQAQAAAPAVAAATPPPASVRTVTPRTPARVKPTPEPVAAPAPVERSAPVNRQEATSTPTPAPAPAPTPAVPAFRNVTIPDGTSIPVRITQTLDSGSTQQGQTFSGTVATDIITDGLVAIRQGTPVTGRVSAVHEAAHYKGSALLSIELTSIDRRGESIAVSTDPYTVEGKGRGKNTAAKVGGGAAVGAILGGILGGGKGAAVGAATGGGLGAGANTVTRGEQVKIPSESLVNFHLTNSLAVRVSTSSTLSTTRSTNNNNGDYRDDRDSQRRPMNPPQDQPQ